MAFPTTAGSLAAWVDQNANIPGTGTPVNAASVNAIITEINALTNTLGASALALSNLAENPATTTALIWGWQAGRVVEDNVVSNVAAGTINLVDNTPGGNYIEYSATAATMYCNQTAFTTGRKPIAKVITSGGFITGTVASRDQRTWLNIFSGTALAAGGSYTITGAWTFDDMHNVTFHTGMALRTGTTAGNTLLLQGYNTSGTPAYNTVATITAVAGTPTLDLITSATIGSAYIYRAGGTTIPTSVGGTGIATGSSPFTANGLFYASSTTAMANGANFTYDGTTVLSKTIDGVSFNAQTTANHTTDFVYSSAATIFHRWRYSDATGNLTLAVNVNGGASMIDQFVANYAGGISMPVSLTTPIVYGSAAVNGTLSLVSTSYASASTTDAVYIKGGANGNNTIAFFGGTGTYADRVGIGTVTPGAKVEIYQTGNTIPNIVLSNAQTAKAFLHLPYNANVQDFIIDVNRHAITGVFGDTAMAHARMLMHVENNNSYISFDTIAASNTIAVTRMLINKDGLTTLTSSTEQLRLAYTGGTYYTSFTTGTTGGLKIGINGTEKVDIAAATGLVTIASGLTVTAGGATITAGNLGVGVAVPIDCALSVAGITSTAAEQIAINARTSFTANATTAGYAILARAQTAAASYTMVDAYGVYVQNSLKGSGSAITNSYGVYIEAQSGAGTTNIGLYNAGTTTLVGVTSIRKFAPNNQVGSASVATATPTSLFSGAALIDNVGDVWLVVGTDTDTLGFTCLYTDVGAGGGHVVTTLQARGAGVAMSISGDDLQITHTLGTTRTIYYRAVLISAK
ncbi:hypothetical protein D4S03_02425 [bacterium]|nr:MAG: hypothetical protein D4S03_02425 [bacterium]